jgi:hypothetical protein
MRVDGWHTAIRGLGVTFLATSKELPRTNVACSWRKFSGPKQLSESYGIPAIGLDMLAWTFGNQRGCDDGAVRAHGKHPAIQIMSIAVICHLIYFNICTKPNILIGQSVSSNDIINKQPTTK